MRAGWILAAGLMAAGPAYAKPCAALIGVAANGDFYEDRGGAWVRQRPKTVQEVLEAGCYPEGGPSPTSSVTLELARHAPATRVQQMYELLARTGWPKERVIIVLWANAPRRPVR